MIGALLAVIGLMVVIYGILTLRDPSDPHTWPGWLAQRVWGWQEGHPALRFVALAEATVAFVIGGLAICAGLLFAFGVF